MIISGNDVAWPTIRTTLDMARAVRPEERKASAGRKTTHFRERLLMLEVMYDFSLPMKLDAPHVGGAVVAM